MTATTVVAVVQSLTPYALLLLVPIIVVALARRHLMLATVATAVGFADRGAGGTSGGTESPGRSRSLTPLASVLRRRISGTRTPRSPPRPTTSHASMPTCWCSASSPSSIRPHWRPARTRRITPKFAQDRALSGQFRAHFGWEKQVNRAGVVAAWLIVGALGMLALTQAIGVRRLACGRGRSVVDPVLGARSGADHRGGTRSTPVDARHGCHGDRVRGCGAGSAVDRARSSGRACRRCQMGLRVASANLWYQNTEVATVADELERLDADVLVLSEYTVAHQATLEASGLADMYPHKSEDPRGRGPTRMSVWSKLPLSDRRGRPARRRVEFEQPGNDAGDIADGAVRACRWTTSDLRSAHPGSDLHLPNSDSSPPAGRRGRVRRSASTRNWPA